MKRTIFRNKSISKHEIFRNDKFKDKLLRFFYYTTFILISVFLLHHECRQGSAIVHRQDD